MDYDAFEAMMSPARMGRYLAACRGSKEDAVALYSANLQLSHNMFMAIACFEVVLRNAIDKHYTQVHGPDWLSLSVRPGGFFDNPSCTATYRLIRNAQIKWAGPNGHQKMVADLDFGFWRYLFAQPQFRAAGQSLLRIFPNKPRSNAAVQYNHTFMFNELAELNILRNRIAHHEAICFMPGQAIKSTQHVRDCHALILDFFSWMGLNMRTFLFRVEETGNICDRIDQM